MIFVVSKSIVKTGRAEDYKQLAAKLIEETRKEKGCISYDLCEDTDNPNTLTFIEKWEDRESLEAHFNTPHFKEIVPMLRGLRESAELNIYKEAL